MTSKLFKISVQLIPFTAAASSANELRQPPADHKSPTNSDKSNDDIAISASLVRTDFEISGEFTLRGDTSTIQWPALEPQAKPGTELWKHTCFELFIAEATSHAYLEYNFSPSRRWATYAFEDYRLPALSNITSQPEIDPLQLTHNTFSMQFRLPLVTELLNKSLAVGVCAVIETTDGARRYFALTHCAQKPDFHLRDSFLIKMN